MNYKELDIKTLRRTYSLYCRANHLDPSKFLCQTCTADLNYSNQKTLKCPFKKYGRTCSSCKVHCYDKDHRDRIRTVMRFTGPRLILHNPVLAGRHLFLTLKFRKKRL
ncbi:nitrous oxide-stimulated promoter family protein [Oceanispirochaeta sp.]|uniref:nitrous oxide-stimulated promoter family protein n=1 Tax=Oceanispirochaeta sp. TaxID=2035350 RepID=UPI00345DB0BA